MALSVTHTFVSPVVDNGDPNEVGPDEWNAAHTLTGAMSAAQHGAQTDDTLHALATSGAAGFMSTSDKIKLDAISGTNTGDQNLFGTISVATQSDVVADTTSDTLTLAAGSGIAITTNAATDTITIAATGGGGGSPYANWFTVGEISSDWYDKWTGSVTGLTWVTEDTSISAHIRPYATDTIDSDEMRLLDFKVAITEIIPGDGWNWVVSSETEFRGQYGIMFIAQDFNVF